MESFDFGFGIVDAEWGKRAESLKLKAESRGQKTEFGMRNGEGGIFRFRISDLGLWIAAYGLSEGP